MFKASFGPERCFKMQAIYLTIHQFIIITIIYVSICISYKVNISQH